MRGHAWWVGERAGTWIQRLGSTTPRPRPAWLASLASTRRSAQRNSRGRDNLPPTRPPREEARGQQQCGLELAYTGDAREATPESHRSGHKARSFRLTLVFSSQITEQVLDLELFPSDAVTFVPVYLSGTGCSIRQPVPVPAPAPGHRPRCFTSASRSYSRLLTADSTRAHSPAPCGRC